jgi:para-aminobenzoate synthetase component 2
MIAIIDNYDSFTYNLAQFVGELGYQFKVYRNDQITVSDIAAKTPSHIIISPGPGRSENAGISCEAVEYFADKIPIFGVCLGHQCIAQVYRGKIGYAPQLKHGKASRIFHTGDSIFQGIPSPFEAARYHSLIVSEESLPENIIVTAYTADGEVMGIRLKDRPVAGVQFHPESYITKYGKQLLANFLNMR